MDTGCTVTFDGDKGGTYFIDCESVKYINGSDLSNDGYKTLYLYRDKYNSHFTITIHSCTYASYQVNNGYTYTTNFITNAKNIRFNAMANVYRNLDYVYLFVVFIVSVYCLFKMLRGFVR
jgi:hypothetical protein